MSVKAIMSCKLYKASPRKDKIRAALASPINVELVQQLSEYLDEPYIQPAAPVPPIEDELNVDNDVVDIDEGGSSNSKPATDIPADKSGDELGLENEEQLDDGIILPEDGSLDKDDPELDSSKVVKGISITAASAVPDELKGSLNTRQDTAGVERVTLKDNEMWIYYNDKMNLNNIMTPVIEYLNAAVYSYLTFNRLARSENAIVFELSIDDTNDTVEPIKPSEVKK